MLVNAMSGYIQSETFHPGAAIFRFAAIVLLLAMAGCGSQTSVEKLYQDSAAAAGPYGRLLVVGIARDGETRKRIEELIAENLADENVTAIPGYTRLGTSAVLMQDEIEAAATASGSDAILLAHLVSASVDAEFRTGRVDVKSECRGGNPVDFFLYDREELREPDSVVFAHEVTMVTNLYDSRTGTRIWTIQSTCFEKSGFDAVLRKEARAIVRQLSRDGLIRRAG
jgi:hypothetical protein